jgi:Serine/threonine protein kinase
MGEIYLARDNKLDRFVALKMLPQQVSADQSRMNRFIQEAKSASALNHPNIITIYEIEESTGVCFIAMEFVDGETLRQRLAQTPLTVPEVLDVAIQVSSALAAAHEAGIVHRDIKPDNIMLRRDGIVKVLDFGLAKLTEKAYSIDNEAPTRAQVNTAPGTVMGTASYMSPEQARGTEVDSRTDIWSVGILVYEMLTGRCPFSGNTTSDVIASILRTTPIPVSRIDPEIPEKLDEVVTKALEKDREERYQGSRDLLVDLRKLKKKIDFQSQLDRSVSSETTLLTNSEGMVKQTGSGLPIHSTATVTNQSSAEYIVSRVKQHKVAFLTGLVTVVVASMAILFWYQRTTRNSSNVLEPSFSSVQLARLTSTGKARNAAISPDGNFVVHVVDEAGKQSLWVRQVATGSNVQIVPPAAVTYWGLTFARDGTYIYYVFRPTGSGVGFVSRVPTLGGSSVKLLGDVDSAITLSPEGTQFAFVRWNPTEATSGLWIANADGTGERRIAIRKNPEELGAPAVGFGGGSGPSWSSDGKMIACAETTVENGVPTHGVVAINAADGSQKVVSSQKWASIGRVTWLPSGAGLILTARIQSTRPFNQIWYVAFPGGQARQITNDLNNYSDVTITSDSSKLAVVQSDVHSSIWIAPDGNADRAKQMGSSQYEGIAGVAIGPDGTIVYASGTGSNGTEIWSTDKNGGNVKQLTANGYIEINPSVSPDGRSIVFVSNRGGQNNAWRMNIDGTEAKQITTDSFLHAARFSPDGRWLVYDSDKGKASIWKSGIDGGDRVNLSESDVSWPAVSPDGKSVAAWSYSDYLQEGLASSRHQIAILPMEKGLPVKFLEIPQSSETFSNLEWTSDGRAIIFADARDGIGNIWRLPVDSGEPKQLTNFKSDLIMSFAWSPNGHELVCSRGSYTSDVVLMTNLK